MFDLNKLVRENVIRLKPYSSARDEFTGKSGIFLDANENPFGTLNRYPDPYQRDLKNLVAKVRGIDAERIFLGNGSDEIIDLCFRIFCNPGTDKALTFTPTYGMYEVAAGINDVEIIKIPLNESFQIDIAKAQKYFFDRKLKLIFICSPNNPTSNSMNFDDVESIIKEFTGIVVIDEAYIDFSEKPSLLKLVEKYPNLIVMQTFSKAFGMAAVRVGMAFTNIEIIRYFNKMKPPYNISMVNQQSVIDRLDRMDNFRTEVDIIIEERKRISNLLSDIGIIKKIYPSDANFILVEVADADRIYDLLVKENIIVRNRNSVIRNCLRITIGKKSENDRLIKALKDISL